LREVGGTRVANPRDDMPGIRLIARFIQWRCRAQRDDHSPSPACGRGGRRPSAQRWG